MASTNIAAWLPGEKVVPFEVKSAPMPTPGEHQLLVRNRAVAINPIDGALQYTARYPLTYPYILGQDTAGEVVSVGPNVTEFKPGDRVFGNGLAMLSQNTQEGTFQEYLILHDNMVCEIPEGMSFEQASVLPLGVSTAASGLFQENFLKLQVPTEPAQKPTGQTVLVWGGASSVGCNAIQLAAAAGYEVFATASPKNFDFVKKLGASQVFDYKKSDVVADLVEALKDKTLAGIFDCIGQKAWTSCTEIAQKSNGSKFVATTARGFPDPPEGVTMLNVFAITIAKNFVGKAVYRDFLPQALRSGKYIAAPEPLVSGHGVESIQGGIDRYRAGGISAKKVVVTL